MAEDHVELVDDSEVDQLQCEGDDYLEDDESHSAQDDATKKKPKRRKKK